MRCDCGPRPSENQNVPAYDIRERAFEFATSIVKLYFYLVKETETPRRIAEQLLAAGTGVGSNLEEAEAGYSHPDFVVKISIVLSLTAIRKNAGHR